MKNIKIIIAIISILLIINVFAMPAFASDAASTAVTANEEEAADPTSAKAMAAALAIGITAAAGAIGMAIAIAKSAESIARQPEMAGKINSAMMLGLVFIETAIIYALIVAIIIIFVL